MSGDKISKSDSDKDSKSAKEGKPPGWSRAQAFLANRGIIQQGIADTSKNTVVPYAQAVAANGLSYGKAEIGMASSA
jgi:hypothetical protein